MLKLIMFARRLPHLSRTAFDDHWLNRHGPLVRSFATTLGIRRYIQSMPLGDMSAQAALEAGRGTLPTDFDGCGELWWDSLEAHRQARATPEGQAALAALVEDERRFVDLSRSLIWYCSERALIG